MLISEGIEVLGDCALLYTPNMCEIELPSTLKSIGYLALWNTGLNTIKYNGSENMWNAIVKDKDFMDASDQERITFQFNK